MNVFAQFQAIFTNLIPERSELISLFLAFEELETRKESTYCSIFGYLTQEKSEVIALFFFLLF